MEDEENYFNYIFLSKSTGQALEEMKRVFIQTLLHIMGFSVDLFK